MRKNLVMAGIIGLTVLALGYTLFPRRDKDDSWHFIEAGKIPVQHEGRIKPLEAVARVHLAQISHKQTQRAEVEVDGKAVVEYRPAVQWLLSTMTASMKRPDAKDLNRKVVPVNDEVAAKLALPAREDHLYSFNEVAKPMMQVRNLVAEFRAAGDGDPEVASRVSEYEKILKAVQTVMLELVPLFNMHEEVVRIDSEDMLNLMGVRDLQRPTLRYSPHELMPRLLQLSQASREARAKDKHAQNGFDHQVLDLNSRMGLIQRLADPDFLLVLPPDEGNEWLSAQHDKDGKFMAILDAYRKNDREKFNSLVDNYVSAMRTADIPMAKVSFESYFSRAEPFWWGMWAYIGLFLVCTLSWIPFAFANREWFHTLNRAAFWSMLAVFAVHTGGIVARMILQGRPPVTNLYASAVFIGWGCVGLSLILESIPRFRYSIALAVGATAGFGTLIIAHLLNRSGDTIDQLVPVLATQFWLATHVVCITIGYTTMFVAGLLGIGYIIVGLFTTALDREALRLFGKVIYGVVCFAMFLSFVGTVLGGIWADESWGRFWGWDPKENGALLIVIWNAIILHARWGGMIRDRGVAVLAVGGNIVTAWSWFGTNLLGVGLHSYGFMAGAFIALIAFIGSQLVIIGIGCIPLSGWRGLQARA